MNNLTFDSFNFILYVVHTGCLQTLFLSFFFYERLFMALTIFRVNFTLI